MERFSGKLTPLVSTEAVMLSLAPTFTVATANNPVPVVPGIFTMPSFVGVATNATMSATGVADAENSNVLIPVRIGAERSVKTAAR